MFKRICSCVFCRSRINYDTDNTIPVTFVLLTGIRILELTAGVILPGRTTRVHVIAIEAHHTKVTIKPSSILLFNAENCEIFKGKFSSKHWIPIEMAGFHPRKCAVQR